MPCISNAALFSYFFTRRRFSKVKHFYIKRAYDSTCCDYEADAGETKMNGDWFYTNKYGVLVMEERPQKGLDPAKLHYGQLPNPKVLQEKVLER